MSDTVSPFVHEEVRAVAVKEIAIKVFNGDEVVHPKHPPSQIITFPDHRFFVWRFAEPVSWSEFPPKDYKKAQLQLSIQCGNIGIVTNTGNVLPDGIYENIYGTDRPAPPSRKAVQDFGHVYALTDLYTPVPDPPLPTPIRDFLIRLATDGRLPGSSTKYPNRCLSGALVDASGLGLSEHKLIRGIRELLPDTAFFHTLYHRGVELEALSDVRNHLDNLCGTKHDWPHRTCWLPATPPERKVG